MKQTTTPELQVNKQLARISEIQAELHRALLEDKLEKLEELVAEIDERLRSLNLEYLDKCSYRKLIISRLATIKLADQELLRLLAQKVQIARHQLKRFSESIRAADRYTTEPTRILSVIRHSTDLAV